MKTLLLFLMSSGATILSAQAWCPTGARWIYNTGSPWITARTQFSYVGDTVVDGSIAQRISQEGFITELFGNDTLIETSGEDIITRSEEAVVFRWIEPDLAWDTLYWFSAEPGDEWTPAWAFGEVCEPDFRLIVLDTGSMMVQGIWLRTLTVQRLSGADPVGDPELIAERLGTVTGYFEPIAGCNSVFECYCSFQCYSDADISYPLAGEQCDLTLGIRPGRGSGGMVHVFPNPATDHVSVRGTGIVSFHIRDGSGRTLLSGNFPPGTPERISLRGLHPGMYFLSAGSDGNWSHLPLVKE